MNALLILAHDRIESAMQFYAGGHGGFHDASSAAVGTILVNSIAEAFLRSLTSHLHQAELRNGENMCLGLVAVESLLHQSVNCLLVFTALHIDEVGYDQSTDVA